MTTQDFIKTNKQNIKGYGTIVTHDMWRVTTEEISELPAHMKAARWFPIFGSKIKAMRKVTIKGVTCYADSPDLNMLAQPPGVTDTYIEVETDHAVACIVDFVIGPEVGGVVLKCGLGNKNPCMTLGTWKKRGHKVGHAMPWSLVQHMRKQSASPKSASSEVCPARAYAALAGKSYGL